MTIASGVQRDTSTIGREQPTTGRMVNKPCSECGEFKPLNNMFITSHPEGDQMACAAFKTRHYCRTCFADQRVPTHCVSCAERLITTQVDLPDAIEPSSRIVVIHPMPTDIASTEEAAGAVIHPMPTDIASTEEADGASECRELCKSVCCGCIVTVAIVGIALAVMGKRNYL